MTMSSASVKPQLLSYSISDMTIDLIRSLEPQVRMVDSDDSIQLFCYSNCSDDDPDYIKACRGVVFENDELILKPFSYTPEFTINDKEVLVSKLSEKLDQCRIFDSHEGVLIRCFYAQNKWYISTHRRLDAYKSKWASRISFGEAFEEALRNEDRYSEEFRTYMDSFVSPTDKTDECVESILDTFMNTLDKANQYMFLVEHSRENRIVCESTEPPRVFHVGTFSNDKLILESNIGLRTPKETNFTSLEELMDYVENIDEQKLQGVIVFTPTDQIKIMNSRYMYWFSLRGNEPSVKFRYLQLRMDMERIEDFKLLYPEYVRVFDSYEDILYEIMSQIKNAYIKRYIKKEYVTMPPEEFSVMRDIHNWHIQDRANNHICANKVIDILNQQAPSKLNKMIRRFMNEERQKTMIENNPEPSFENKILSHN